MNEISIIAPVRKTVRVKAPVAHAFETFTSGLTRWWPPNHGIGKKPIAKVEMEPKLGGRWLETCEDGTQTTVATITLWEPPHRFVMYWQVSAQWKPDASMKSEVDVRFTPDGDGTLVELLHHKFETMGEGGAKLRGDVDGGWPTHLQNFAREAERGTTAGIQDMAKVQILGMPQSPMVWAVRMAAAEKNIDVELVPTMPHVPELLAIQPFGKMPGLSHGDVAIGESAAIARYLDKLSATNPLVPCDAGAAARVDQWLMHYHVEFMPAILGRYIAPYFFPKGADGKPDRTAIEAALPGLRSCVAILEKQLACREYVAGAFSLADLFYGPLLHYANVLPEGAQTIAASPNVARYLARMSERPAFKATFPPPMPARAAA